MNTLHQTLSSSLIAVGLLVCACSDNTDLPRSTQTVDGITIYVGVMPAELVKGHITASGEPGALHGGTTPASSSHHIVVALFDSGTGAHITDAQIRAGVRDRSNDHEPDMTLEPMQINGAMSYGNFFQMQGPGVWRIHLEILRPGMSAPIEADFGYEHVLL